jgi:hypothetical protein
MDREATIKLDYSRLVEIWKANMNTGIWVANRKSHRSPDAARQPRGGCLSQHPDHRRQLRRRLGRSRAAAPARNRASCLSRFPRQAECRSLHG